MRLGKRKPDATLFDARKVDVVSVAADGIVELALVQANAWSGSDAEVESFQQKVQTYVAYAVDGGMVTDYPETRDQPWRVVVHSHVSPPDEKTQQVIEVLATRLPTYGGTIESRVTSG